MMSKTLLKKGRKEFPIKRVTEAKQKVFWFVHVWYKKTFIPAILHVPQKTWQIKRLKRSIYMFVQN